MLKELRIEEKPGRTQGGERVQTFGLGSLEWEKKKNRNAEIDGGRKWRRGDFFRGTTYSVRGERRAEESKSSLVIKKKKEFHHNVKSARLDIRVSIRAQELGGSQKKESQSFIPHERRGSRSGKEDLRKKGIPSLQPVCLKNW